jgi:leucine efflux protein
MFGITDLATFIIGTIVIVLLPGPNSMYVMTTAARNGVGAGFKGAAGVFCGDLALMTLSVAGVASLVQTTPWLFNLLKYAGALYLVWLGLGLLRSAIKRDRDQQVLADIPSGNGRSPFKVALTISLLNPKAILFFMSFFIQFVDPNYHTPLLTFALLGVMVQIISQTYLASLVLGMVFLKGRFQARRGIGAIAKTGVGAGFIGYGLKLALSSS